MLNLLGSVEWDFAIVDEAHRIKNRKAQWTRNIKKLRIDRKHIMTGTGFINDPSEMWSLLNFLAPKIFRSYHGFRREYCDEIIVGGFPKVIGVRPDKVEQFRDLRKEVGVRREMAVVHSSISEPIFTAREVDLNPTQRKMYDEIKRELATLDQQGAPIHSPNVLSQLNRLRQICVATPELVRSYYDPKQERRVQEIRLVEPSSKLDEVESILEELRWDAESKQQVVVFSNFKDPIELLKARFDKKPDLYPYIHMKVEDNDAERYRKWHDEFPKRNHRVFMSTLQLGGESINLTPASYCIFLDRSWSPKDNMQAVGRVYRPGQKRAVEVIHINARKTTDQRIERSTNEKMGWFKQIFGEDD
jgi:SNF2 family DNA or RNA helicase